jgi:hypothetical protein
MPSSCQSSFAVSVFVLLTLKFAIPGSYRGLFLMQIGTYLSSTRKNDGWLQKALVYGVLAVNVWV